VRATPRWPYWALAALALLLILLELSIGAVSIPFADVARILFTGESERSTWLQIVQQFRLIRALNALFSGAAIAVCGLLLQTLFRNPLADPYVLGVMDGARLGVALVVVVSGAASNTFLSRFAFLGNLSQVAAAALGSVLAMAVLLWIAHRVSTVTLLISGLMLGYLCQGLISVVLHFTDEYQAAAFSAWNDGSYAGITRAQLSLLIPLTALGIATNHTIEAAAAVLLATGMLCASGLIVFVVARAAAKLSKLAALLFAVSGSTLLLTMTLAATFALTSSAGRGSSLHGWVPLQTMIDYHGLANAVGFSLSGLTALLLIRLRLPTSSLP